MPQNGRMMALPECSILWMDSHPLTLPRLPTTTTLVRPRTRPGVGLGAGLLVAAAVVALDVAAGPDKGALARSSAPGRRETGSR